VIDKDFLQKLIKKPENITKLSFESISEILNQVIAIFEKEDLLLEFDLNESEKAIVIGDIHGNLETLIKLVEIISEEKPKPKYVIFLGDIVDRGPKQLECLIFVYALKILDPQSVYILKGNHETFEMNKIYGFYYDFINKFKDYKKFNKILSVYKVLPYCAIVNKSILCLHGGIPEDFEIINKIRGLKSISLTIDLEKSVGGGLYQIMWNDPKPGLKNFTYSFRGPDIKFFGEEAFKNFMDKYNLKYLIRAHEAFPEGYRWFFDDRLLSIFSSANYRGDFDPNSASYAIIENNSIFPNIIEL